MKQEFISSGLALADFVHRHPRRITAALAAILMVGASGAFAVASLAPAAPTEPIRLMSEPLLLGSLDAQADLLGASFLTLYRSGQTHTADSAPRLLERLGVADPVAAAFLAQDKTASQALFGRGAAGRSVTAQANEQLALTQLKTRWIESGDATHFKSLVVDRTSTGFESRVEKHELAQRQRIASGVLGQETLGANGETELPKAVAAQLDRVFADTAGGHSKLRRGDRFAVVYETWEADGEVMRTGRILSAEVNRNGDMKRVLWFADHGSAGEYYTFDGERVEKSDIDLPLGRLRVTSSFGMRVHPVFGGHRGHSGIDLAAPTGTPIYAAADGKVEFAGVQRGYGKVVYLRHSGSNETSIYGHMSQINARVGQRVSRGDKLGEVGSTGIATGPHLHFEVRVGDVPEDPAPLLAEAQRDTSISRPRRAAFDKFSLAMDQQLAAASELTPGGFE